MLNFRFILLFGVLVEQVYIVQLFKNCVLYPPFKLRSKTSPSVQSLVRVAQSRACHAEQGSVI